MPVFSKFSRLVAQRYLWSKRSEAFISIITIISVIGVAVGVMVLTIVMAVMTGFQKELRDRILGANAHILVRSSSGHINNWQKILETVRSVAGVSSASAFVQAPAFLRVGERATGLLVRGIEPDSSAARQVAEYMGVKDHLSIFNPPPVYVTAPDGNEEQIELPALVIGRELQRSLGILAGAPVSLLSSQTSSTPFGLMPKFRRFVVSGVYASGLVEYESGLAYMPLEESQKFFGLKNMVSGLEVRVHRIDSAPKIAELISADLGGLSSGLYTQDWTRNNQALWEALALEKKVYFTVLTLIVIMASFSIITTLIMLVLEKRKDIAVLRTLGATSAAVGSIFFIQGATIGLSGTLLGLLLGFGGCVFLREYGYKLPEGVFPVETLPIQIEYFNFALVGVVAFLICCLATIYPSFRASRMEPVEILRYE